MERTRLRTIITETAILHSDTSHIVTSKNLPARWLLDLRRTFLHGTGLTLAAELFWQHYANKLPFQVGGLESGSVPLIAAIILEGERRGTPINGFFIRKERKTIGRQQVIEGVVTRDPIVVVDDLLNSGGTLAKVVTALKEIHRGVRDLFVIVQYDNPVGIQYLHDNKIRLTSLFTLAELGLTRGQPEKSPPQLPVRPLWHFRHREPNYFHVVPKSAPVLDDTQIYFGTDSSVLYCLKQSSGTVVWQCETGPDREGKGIFSTPAVVADKVYVGSYDGNCYCLNAKNGHIIWRAAVADWIGSSPCIAQELGRLFIGLEHARPKAKGGLAALDLATGTQLFECETASVLHGSPTYDAATQTVVVGTNDGEILAVHGVTGKTLWRCKTGGPLRSAPIIAGTQVFGASEDGALYALQLKTGAIIWQYRTHNLLYTTPVVDSTQVYLAATDKHLYILNRKNGVLRAKIPTKGRLYAPPLIVDDKLYIGGTCGILYQVDCKKMRITGRYQFPERIVNRPAYNPVTKRFFLPTYDNQLFTFHLQRRRAQ